METNLNSSVSFFRDSLFLYYSRASLHRWSKWKGIQYVYELTLHFKTKWLKIILLLCWCPGWQTPFLWELSLVDLNWGTIDKHYYNGFSCKTVIQHFYTLWNGSYKSSYNLSPYKVKAILLTLFLKLYITSQWLIYFITRSFYFFFFFLILIFYFL